jgi:glycosyltransferase involved in cell wall biosynthesis
LVDDGSTDRTLEFAARFNVKLLSLKSRRGPANARNLGALSAKGDILLFLDSDVGIHADTVSQVIQIFQSSPELDGVFGSYDDQPAAPGLVSQFRNLLHCYTHRTAQRRASTFWAGCGAIRREIFVGRNGFFNTTFSVPCVEDIELGMRLVRTGSLIACAPEIQVKHYKSWTMKSMMMADFRWRGIPWTRLILASRHLPNDLNLRLSSRASVLITTLAFAFSLLSAIQIVEGYTLSRMWPEFTVINASFLSILALNYRFYCFLYDKRGWRFSLQCIPLHLCYFLCCALAFLTGVVQHFCSSSAMAFNRKPAERATQSLLRTPVEP